MNTPIAWLLNAAYVLVLLAFSPLIAWSAWRTGKYRAGYGEKLLGRVPNREGDRFCVWLHAVSVGEVNLLATTLREVRQRQPDWDIVISTTTKTGYDLAQRKYGDDYTVFYCPLDFSWATNRAMRRLRPHLLVLAELELWPNLIHSAKSHGAQVAIINGRLSDNSFRGYRWIGWLARRVLEQVDLVAAQDEGTAERFLKLGAKNVAVTGSLKYDGAETHRDNPRTRAMRELAGYAAGGEEVVWLAGSTQAPEEAICLDVFNRLRETFPQLRLVIVPRHPERFEEVAKLLDESGLPWQRRTDLDDSAIRNPQSAIISVDTVGELSAWWGMASIGFVGGSFGDRGGQNMIEPAAYGVATCFGPNTRNFRDIVSALLNANAAEVVAGERELEAFVRRCLESPEKAAQLGTRGREFVATQLGATARTVGLLEQMMKVQSPSSSEAA